MGTGIYCQFYKVRDEVALAYYENQYNQAIALYNQYVNDFGDQSAYSLDQYDRVQEYAYLVKLARQWDYPYQMFGVGVVIAGVVIVAMGAVISTLEEVRDLLQKRGGEWTNPKILYFIG